MPYKKSYKKRFRRRRYKKPAASTASGPLATRLKAKLIYSEYVRLNPGLGGLVDDYVFSANGLFDPNITSTGHQPRGFDQLMNLYDHATVIGAKITVACSNGDTTGGNLVTLSLRDSDTAIATYFDAMEYRYIKKAVLGVEQGTATKNISMKCNPNKFLGRGSPLSEDNLRNSISSNPNEQAYFHLSGMPMEAGVDTAAVNCIVRIEYTVIFTEPKQPTQS